MNNIILFLNKHKDDCSYYMIFKIEVIMFLVIYGFVRICEHSLWLSFALFLYRAAQTICVLILAILLFIWQIKKTRRQGLWLIPILFAIPLFFFCINAGVPQRYKKLQMVNLVQQGRSEELKAVTDNYYAERFIEFSGKERHEDVLFHSLKEKKINGQYHTYGYLYSEDDRSNTYFGMYEVIEMIHLDGNWYRVNMILQP